MKKIVVLLFICLLAYCHKIDCGIVIEKQQLENNFVVKSHKYKNGYLYYVYVQKDSIKERFQVKKSVYDSIELNKNYNIKIIRGDYYFTIYNHSK